MITKVLICNVCGKREVLRSPQYEIPPGWTLLHAYQPGEPEKLISCSQSDIDVCPAHDGIHLTLRFGEIKAECPEGSS